MKKSKKKKKIILIVIISIVVLAIIGGITVLLLSGKFVKNKVKEKTETKEEIKTELDLSIEEQYGKDLYTALTTYGAFFISDYNYFTAYPMAYQDSMIYFDAEVVKVIEEDNNKYKLLVDYNDIGGNELNAVIEGEYNNGVRYLNGEVYYFMGIFNGMKTYEIDGAKNVLPSLKAKKVVLRPAASESNNFFTESELNEAAKKFFNNYPMTFSQPSYSLDAVTKSGQYLTELPFHYLIKLENTGNYKFDEFRIYTGSGDIEVVTDKENSEIYRYITKASDGKGYLLSSYQLPSEKQDVQLYDKDFKQKWSREYENAADMRYMNVNGLLVVYCSNTLYYIDEKTGKNIIEPITVANVIKIRPLSNGDVIVFSSDKSKFIQYIDSKGKVKWTNSTEYDPTSIETLEVGNGKIYVNYNVAQNEEEDYVTVYSKTGEKLATTIPQN